MTSQISGSSHAAYACICPRSRIRSGSSSSMYAAPIASSASGPRLPSAARWKSSRLSRKHRAITALKSSFLVPKSRKTYGCEIPAAAAIASVEAPSRPRRANSSSAASRTVSRRSSAVFRWVETVTPAKLVITYLIVKCRDDPVDLRLAEAGVQRQRERPLEARLRARETALVAVRGQTLERVRPDLRLDSLGAERREHLVAPFDLDDVGLPPVVVALVRLRRRHDAREALVVRLRDTAALAQQLVEPGELRD